MAIQPRIKSSGLGLFLSALLLAISGVSIAHAQDAVENTPPELRDFRLDPSPREGTPESPGPEPSAQPSATPPIAEPTPAPVNRPSIPTVAEPQRTAPAPSVDITPKAQTEPAGEPSLREPIPTPDVTPTDTQTQPQTGAAATPTTEGIGTSGIIALVGLLLAIAGGAFILWRRRQFGLSATLARRQAAKPTTPPTPRASPSRAQPVAPIKKPTPVRGISMAFAPEKAVVSVTSLNIKGQLHITNASDAAAENLALSAVLISASKEQQQAIDQFFAHSDHIVPALLGSIKPGGHMDLPLQLGVALHEMQTFSLQHKTLLAPILLAKLVCRAPDGSAQEVARLICMIGRESTPPKPKMGPLRLDQGPRSFDRLGQRALLS